MMWCGIAAIVLSGLFPLVKKPARRLEIGFLFDDYEHLQCNLILILCIVAALVTVGLIITLKDNRKAKKVNIGDYEL